MRVVIHPDGPDGQLYRWHVTFRGWGYTGHTNSRHGAWASVKTRYALLLEVTE